MKTNSVKESSVFVREKQRSAESIEMIVMRNEPSFYNLLFRMRKRVSLVYLMVDRSICEH